MLRRLPPLKRPAWRADHPFVTLTAHRRDQAGGIVVGWLTKLVIGLSLVGVVGYDVAALAIARFNADDQAREAARSASQEYRSSRNVQNAYDAAVASLQDSGATIDTGDFEVAQDGTVALTLRTRAETVVVEKVGPLKRYADVVQRASRKTL